MAKIKYDELASSVIELVGNKENIEFCTHCMTRLRFNVKDQSLVNLKEIEKIEGVIGCQWSNDQLQIIIGPKVADVYKEVMNKVGLENNEIISETTRKKFNFGMILDGITGCLTPLIPVMIGAGMIKVLVLLGEMSGIVPVDSNTYLVLSFVGDTGFYFMPVFIGANAAKKFGGNMGLGMMVGAMLIHPNFLNAIAEGNALDLFNIPIYPASYASSIFPAIISVFAMCQIEKFVAKHSPDALRSLLEPLLTIVIMIPLSLCILSPLGAIIGEYFAAAMMWIYNTVGFLGIGILTAIMPFVILTGMHLALNPGAFQMLATSGFDPIVMPCMVMNNLNQGAACLVVALKTKNKDVRSLALSCAVTVIVGGVSEPAMFGVNLKYKKPIFAAMIGGFCGGCVAGLLKAHAFAFASMGIFGFPAFIGGNGVSALVAIISGAVISMIVTFIVGLFIIKEEDVVL